MDSSRSNKTSTAQVHFSSPRKLGKGKGSGLSIDLPFSAIEYLSKVNSILESEQDREKLFDALRTYHENRRIKKLVKDLMVILDTPKKYPLFNEIRNLIPPEHVFAYNKLTEGAKTGERLVVVRRQGTDPFGFHVRGGKEHGCGIFVSNIIEGSPADGSGLKVGDEVLRINRLILSECIHEEVINILKSRKVVTLVVRFMGQIPLKVDNQLQWSLIEVPAKKTPDSPSKEVVLHRDRLLAFKIGKEGLGCTIRPGIPNHDGVYVSAVASGSLAEQVGLKVGDQIFDVNGKNFNGIKQNEAIEILKAKTQLTMVVRHNSKAREFFERKERAKKEKANEKLANESKGGRRTSILRTGPSPRVVEKHANFGETLIVQVIDTPVEEQFEEIGEIDHTPDPSNTMYDPKVIGKLEAHLITIPKTGPLMIDLAQNEQKIIVTNIDPKGAVADHGFMKRGDWLLNVEGTSLIGSSLDDAEKSLSEAMSRLARTIDLVIACKPGRPPAPISPPAELRSPTKSLPLATGSKSANDDEDDLKVKNKIAAFESLWQGKRVVKRRDSLDKFKNSLKLYQVKKRPDVSPVVLTDHRRNEKPTFKLNLDQPDHPGNITASPHNEVIPSLHHDVQAKSVPETKSPMTSPQHHVNSYPSSPTRSVTPHSPVKSGFVPIPSVTTVLTRGEIASPLRTMSDTHSPYKGKIHGSEPAHVSPVEKTAPPPPSFSIQSQVLTQKPLHDSPSKILKRRNDTVDLVSKDLLREDLMVNAPSTSVPPPPPPLPPSSNEFTSVKSFWKDTELDESEEEPEQGTDFANNDPFLESPRPIVAAPAMAVPKIASTVTNSPLYIPPQLSVSEQGKVKAGPSSSSVQQRHSTGASFGGIIQEPLQIPPQNQPQIATTLIDEGTASNTNRYAEQPTLNSASQTYPYSNNLIKPAKDQVPNRINIITGAVQEKPMYTNSSMPTTYTSPVKTQKPVTVLQSQPAPVYMTKNANAKQFVHSERANRDARVVALQNRLIENQDIDKKHAIGTKKMSLDDLISKDKPLQSAADNVTSDAAGSSNKRRPKSPPTSVSMKSNTASNKLIGNVQPSASSSTNKVLQSHNNARSYSPAKVVNRPASNTLSQAPPNTVMPSQHVSYKQRPVSYPTAPQLANQSSRGVHGQNVSVNSKQRTNDNDSFSWIGSSPRDHTPEASVVVLATAKTANVPPALSKQNQFLGNELSQQTAFKDNRKQHNSSFRKKNESASRSPSFKKVTFQTAGLKDDSDVEVIVDPEIVRRRDANIADGVQAVEIARKQSQNNSPSGAMRQSMVDLRSTSSPREPSPRQPPPSVPSMTRDKMQGSDGVDNGKDNSVVFMDNDKSSHFLSSLNAMLGQANPPPPPVQQPAKQQWKVPGPSRSAVENPIAPIQIHSARGESSKRPAQVPPRDDRWNQHLPPRDYEEITENPSRPNSARGSSSGGVIPPPPKVPVPPAVGTAATPAIGFDSSALNAAKSMLRSANSPATPGVIRKPVSTKVAPPIDNIVDELKNKVFKNDRKFTKQYQSVEDDVTMQSNSQRAISEMDASLQELDNVIRSLDDE